MEEDWVVLCQALYQSTGEEEWTEMHERFKELCKKIGVKGSWAKNWWRGGQRRSSLSSHQIRLWKPLLTTGPNFRIPRAM